jgi:hypothetical protein
MIMTKKRDYGGADEATLDINDYHYGLLAAALGDRRHANGCFCAHVTVQDAC